MDSQRLIVVSSDSHAGMPKELWSEYLDPEFRDLLPNLVADNDINLTSMALLSAGRGLGGHPDHKEAHSTGWHGLHDPVLRLADMDREGIAAELVYHGDSRLGDLFHNVTNREYALDVWESGAQAWNRWANDTFGFALDRFLLTGAIGPCHRMDTAVAEVDRIADWGFTGIYGPGYMRHAAMPQPHDRYWDPFWRVCEERGIAVVVHAGFGTEQGMVFPQYEKIIDDVATKAGSTDREALLAAAPTAVTDDSKDFFTNWVNHNVDSRRPMWQMMFGGVFDRFPGLRLVLTEIRVDWVPATLAFLDEVYEQHRDEIPAQRRPSEYWASNCLAGASFIHKAEAEMRDEIGVETMSFGRDYPHPESTWPHTRYWLRDAFAGVPEDELRLILGENAIRFLDLDRDRLVEIAKRIGPTVDDILGDPSELPPELLENFALRGGYLKPAEGAGKLPVVEQLVRTDLAAVVGG